MANRKINRKANKKSLVLGFLFFFTLIQSTSCTTRDPILETEITPIPAMNNIQLDSTITNEPILITQTQTPTTTVEETTEPKNLTSAKAKTTTSPPLDIYSGPQVIGQSISGREIIIYRFGTGLTHRMIVAGIHGGYEWNTIKLANQLVDYYQQNLEAVLPDKTLYILPSLNPDGEARGHGPDGRANENGVDLNRNFPKDWQADWPRTGCWQMGDISAGDSPLSEPESQALANFLLENDIDALISYHSAGPGFFPGGSPVDENSLNLVLTLSAVSHFPYPPLNTGCKFTGTLADFAVSIGIPALDLELSTHWDSEFLENLKVISAFLSWTRLDKK